MCLIIFKKQKMKMLLFRYLNTMTLLRCFLKVTHMILNILTHPKVLRKHQGLLRHGFKPISFKDLYNALTRKKKLPKSLL